MIIVSVRVTHHGKAGNLDLELTEIIDFHFASDDEATTFGLEINADPACKLIGWKDVRPHSVNSARASLQTLKDTLAREF